MRDIVQALGYEASSASSGEAAMMMMATIQPHVILLDLMMPGISGLEALIYFREHHPAVPVIIITVNVDHEPAPQARAAGAFAVVEKPYDMAPLGQLLARAMEQAPPG
jgi:CheY-like chemotaxis protein